MKPGQLRDMSVNKLVQYFESMALEQGEAIELDETSRYNNLFDLMREVELELRDRAGDQRRALVPLYNHANTQVRLKSAIATLVIEPEAARKVLQEISDRGEFPEAADARGIMRVLDDGTYAPV